MGFVLAWLVFSVLAGVFASKRERSGFGFFLVALLLSPVVAFVWAAVSPGGKECPNCGERIKSRARVCKFCGREVEPTHPLNPSKEL